MKRSTIAVWLAAIVAAAAAHTGEAQARGCSISEVQTLGIHMNVQPFAGWVDVRAVQRALMQACAQVPSRWRYIAGDFTRSTDLIDRLWPGLGSWERSCARSEGGNGRFVWNSQGSGAGGWLQFMPSTFASAIGTGISAARHRGLHPPSYAWSFYVPLGHAFAGAGMIFQGRRSEWQGTTC